MSTCTTTRRRRQGGFTLIELLVVVTVIGLLAGIAAVKVTRTLQRAKENRLRNDLRVMRDLIQQYKVDKKKWPESLMALVEEDYLRAMPVDPITDSDATWIEVVEEPGEDEEEDPAMQDSGVIDVQSGAPGVDLDGVPYSDY